MKISPMTSEPKPPPTPPKPSACEKSEPSIMPPAKRPAPRRKLPRRLELCCCGAGEAVLGRVADALGASFERVLAGFDG